jgi:hypothetical protein
MAWERRHGQFYYYRKVREQGRVRSLYLGRGAQAQAAALADGCPPPVDELAQVSAKKEPVEVALEPAPCATSGENTPVKKRDPEPWPSFLECLRAGRDYHALSLRYAAHTLPSEGESLTAWVARRNRACGEDDSMPARAVR